jgi:DeoR/GlpR family transcriptional regulator of sugar metabolism
MNIAKLQLLMAQSKVNNSNLASMSGVSDVTIRI